MVEEQKKVERNDWIGKAWETAQESMGEFFPIPEGETVMEVQIKDEPRMINTKFGEKQVMKTDKGDVVFGKGLLFEFLKYVQDKPKADSAKIKITRIGVGMDTRYRVSGAE
jgi:hypothetical protein|tara:strand:+ start:8415 stop:8747 length:333 start_codon:yes stop_codon:yes gene_type:complete